MPSCITRLNSDHGAIRRGSKAVTATMVTVTIVLAALPAVALAASAPTAYTGLVKATTTTSTVLGGSVYPGNQPTAYYFQYGQTTAYGTQTPTAAAGTGKASIHVTASLSGLSANTTWHYRLVATNAAGVAYGHDATFRTKKIPLTFKVEAPQRVIYGRPFAVRGTVSGSDSQRHALALQASASPPAVGFTTIGSPTLTDAGGQFSISVPGLTRNTQMRVSTIDDDTAHSSLFVTLVEVAVTLHIHATDRRGLVRFVGSATPAQPGAKLLVQRLGRSGSRNTIRSLRLRGPGSHFDRLVSIRRGGLYRMTVTGLTHGQALVPGHSRAVRIR